MMEYFQLKYCHAKKFCALFALLPLFSSLQVSAYEYDVAYCKKCHEPECLQFMTKGKAMHHRLANRKVGTPIDDEAFDDRQTSYFDKHYHFKKEDGKYLILESSPKSQNTFESTMVLGVEPLIQYITKGERGGYQVLSMAYDPKENEWFDVFGNENRQEGEWGHWRAKGMNWNSNCAYCHTTDFKKNYDLETDSYDSTWLFDGISCLQCHPSLPEACGVKDRPIRKVRGTKVQAMQNCASCHSRREELTANKFASGDNYFDYFRPELPLLKGVYYADGKVISENFVFSSFMMCRQYDAGLTCVDCHDWHTAKLFKPAEKNALCLSCHGVSAKNVKGAPTIDEHAHSFHDDNDGNICINCHMPKTPYMERDYRYDHGFTSPDPYLTKYAGIPNSCAQCHEKIDKDKPERGGDWLLENFEKNYGSERFLRKRDRAMAVSKVHNGDFSPEVKKSLLELSKTETNDAWIAALTNLLSPWIYDDDVYSRVSELLSDKSALVRSAAINAISMRGAESHNLIESHLNDESRLVRIDSAYALRGNVSKNIAAYSELMEYLDFNCDRPVGALKRADMALFEGDFEGARKYALHALKMETTNAQLAREVAILVFRANFKDEALNILLESQKKFPKSTEILYALSLFYAESRDLDKSIDALEKVVEIDSNFSRAWYNMSIAKFQSGDRLGAFEAIKKAIELEPQNSQYLETQAYFKSQ